MWQHLLNFRIDSLGSLALPCGLQWIWGDRMFNDSNLDADHRRYCEIVAPRLARERKVFGDADFTLTNNAVWQRAQNIDVFRKAYPNPEVRSILLDQLAQREEESERWVAQRKKQSKKIGEFFAEFIGKASWEQGSPERLARQIRRELKAKKTDESRGTNYPR